MTDAPEKPSSSSPTPPNEVLELRARVHQLEQTLQDMGRRHLADLKALRQSQHLLNAVLENSPSQISVKDSQGRYILVNRRAEQLLARPRAEILGRTAAELGPAEDAAAAMERDRSVMSRSEPEDLEEQLPGPDGQMRYFLTTRFPLTDASGVVTGVCSIATEITERKRAAEERTALQLQVIEAQRAALRELSTPLIPLAEGVLVMPLIGTIDANRAEQILQTLLEGVSAERARVAILDITGVKVVDAQVASALVRAAHAVRLLGAHVILTGIRAEVAQALIQLGSQLTDLTTRSTLQSGIAHAIKLLASLPAR
jgi:rsbT co-antagonist protein RsbR